MNVKRSIEEIMKAYSEVPYEDFRKKLAILNELSKIMFKVGKPLLASETLKWSFLELNPLNVLSWPTLRTT
ncbi:hypothetical protein [Mesotoga sp. Brook.08.YT.4.2.5.4.]|uniref:hypothetical protein n=1 Tax=Mesotoga sp. Brook.08.YT.4.2.5.4. TaxID=1343998 RepID=UPI000DC4494C|nr:hypothetical protein [Mesotoga sp. Brook.08.YT.4.2.5.4.]RAO96284.1 hypothetical protein M388_02385 [Mesotoga sp. Brook.08.YT.4.2.5.4.]